MRGEIEKDVGEEKKGAMEKNYKLEEVVVVKEGKKYINEKMERKGGGWKTMPYIIGNETFEKLSSMSLIANLVVYLTKQYNMESVTAITIYNIWGGSCNLAPLLGAYLADAYVGRFSMLVYGSIASSLGMWIMALTAAVPGLRPPQCTNLLFCKTASNGQLSVLFIGLGFVAIGAGGIRASNIAFSVDQFDATTEEGRKGLLSFYNWYYLSFTIALIVSLTAVVYIQTNISWSLGLAIPAACMIVSLVVFILGRNVYIYMKPKGSFLYDIANVIVAAFRKRNLRVSKYSLYDPIDPDPKLGSKLQRTNRFTCIDKAAMITDEDEFDSQGLPLNRWRLCSVDQVEALKCLLSILPVWLAALTSHIIMDQQSAFGVQQAEQLDLHLGKTFEVPPGSLGLASLIAIAAYILIYEHVFRKLKRDGIKAKHRMLAGILMSIISMITAGLVEEKRRNSALKHGKLIAPISFAWLLPQYAMAGIIEALTSIPLMEFFNSRLPENMRSFAGAFIYLLLAFASFLNTAIINSIKGLGSKWFGGRDLNMNRIDYYYYLLAGLATINFIYFATFAGKYVVGVDSAERKEVAVVASGGNRLVDGLLHQNDLQKIAG